MNFNQTAPANLPNYAPPISAEREKDLKASELEDLKKYNQFIDNKRDAQYEGLKAEFFYQSVPTNPIESGSPRVDDRGRAIKDAQGNEILDFKDPGIVEILCVRLTPLSDVKTVAVKPANAHYKKVFAREYSEFVTGQSIRKNGIPVETVVKDPAVLDILKANKIYIVEDLAALGEMSAEQVGMGVKAWVYYAQDYLRSGRGEIEKTNSAIEDMKNENADLREKLNRLLAAQSSNDDAPVPDVKLEVAADVNDSGNSE